MYTVCSYYYRHKANATFATSVISTRAVLSKLQVSFSMPSFFFASN